ncbi:tyramine oxidase subunit B [Micrococcus endophyticus]|uniref:Ornithine cyclodeaminase n=1 Tax=Micrococcus endophyticus TaxID=455343 RepID=A0A4Y8ZJ29_9MICC|nr:tyramine oxidase subunit B [Micrococcus endophyticus]MBB5848825.1 ornithine cyclodeaminase [Micrococcus endophyticus]TFI50375.1 ornithine cyclodeaminase [Micrococcus endophyticus]
MSTEINFRYLSEPDMIEAGVGDLVRCTDVMEEALVLMRKGDYMMAGENGNSHGAMITFPGDPEHEGMPKDGPDRRFMAMPAYLGGRFGTTGVKWYGSNAENRAKGLPRSIHVFVLNDRDTGAPLAIMSANLLSAYRTGSVPGVGVKHLAKEDAKTVAVVGPGVIARSTLETTLALRPSIDTLTVKGRGAASTQAFVDWATATFPQLTSATVCESIEEAIADADIVMATTTTDAAGSSAFPYFPKSAIKPGALLLLPAAARFDDDFLAGDDARLVIDAQGLYDAWLEEYGAQAYQILGIPGSHWFGLVEQGVLPAEKIEEIADIATGALPARRNDEEIILYSVGGMPIEDVAWATDLYRTAEEKGIGTVLNLWETPALA